VLAFYLPQFHAIPENDRWWGPGFSEWRNVARGTPRFPGHYQPRLPRDLGFYDLTNKETIRRQAELAGQAGVHGFAFYYYSFNGRRLLEGPLEAFLDDSSIRFPFCAVWANENWTRRWDGLDEEILIKQEYDPADDDKLIDDLQRHFDDPRYIRIQGRPLLPVYRFDVVPDAQATVSRWRERWRERHGEDPLILMVQSFEDDPREYGADGAIEFPPQRLASWDNSINSHLHFFDASFSGQVLEYERVASDAINRPLPPYPLVRGVCPSWDNDARRQGEGMVLQGSTPAGYQRWLSAAIEKAVQAPVLGEPLVFLNAWNEWAEGAYLEPDLHYGAAYLNATARAVCGSSDERHHRKVLLVGHDAHPHGAQMNLRALGKVLKDQFGCEIAYVLLEGGTLTGDYAQLGEVKLVTDLDQLPEIASDLRNRGFENALINTTASGTAIDALKNAGFTVVSLVHELPGLIRRHQLEEGARKIASSSDRVVFPAQSVARAFGRIAEVPPARVEIKPQGLYRSNGHLPADAGDRVRMGLGIPPDARVVLNIGYADMRKGVDIFLQTADQARASSPDVHFIWLGNLSPEAEELRSAMPASQRERVHFAPFTEHVEPFLATADVFFLSSREDPFPAVVLEALAAGLPVVALHGSGGSEELARANGRLVDGNDTAGIVSALVECVAEESPEAAEARRRLVREHYQYDRWGFDLLGLLDPSLKRVSVVVPNYNYAGDLARRLGAIFDQTYPIFELIVLDDCSDDGSLEELDRIQRSVGRRFRVVTNESNSGSPFKQWAKACELARGDYVWIAEADDLSKPEFLERIAPRLAEDDFVFAFSDSAQIDHRGQLLAEDYKAYYREAAGEAMDTDFVMDGEAFVRQCLMERNLILNASSVVWNRAALNGALESSRDQLSDYRLAGDWHLYASAALEGGSVAYVAEPLNVHRRHDESVTHSLDLQRHLDEVRLVHQRLTKWLNPDEDTRDRLHGYESELAAQFGLEAPDSNDRQLEISESIERLCVKYAEPLGVTPAVHERDQILRFLLNHYVWSEEEGAIEYYFSDGRNSAERLASLLSQLNGGNGDSPHGSLLEFASGYGCVTRHLTRVLPEVQVVSSDIHSAAVEFLNREIGVDAFLSSTSPEDFDPPGRFDAIFALSFFSHMPEATWKRWLAALGNCLAEDGVMIFTTQGLASRQYLGDPVIPERGFWFEPDSEQADLDTSEYGQTIVLTDYVRAQIEALGLELRLHEPGYWWDHQDLYVVERNGGG
jgi:glycosyltransferase involved in cell wall biosynthesis